MSRPPPEDKKPNLKNLPRGAIGIKGLPVSRNTRLPSIRSPRDLTLGAAPKKTYVPNIPVRRDKKPSISEIAALKKEENAVKFGQQNSTVQAKDRGKGRSRKQVVQTDGGIFAEGVAQDHQTRKEKLREAYQRSDYTSSRGVTIKKEKNEDTVEISKKMDNLLRDDFMDDGDDNDAATLVKPTIFPCTAESAKTEPWPDFNQNAAKEISFNNGFIKKEESEEVEETQSNTSNELLTQTKMDVVKLLKAGMESGSSALFLVQMPHISAGNQKMVDAEPSHKHPSIHSDSKVSNNENPASASLKSLPEGYVGKIRVMKTGNVKLIVGSMEFCLDSIQSFRSQHEVVSIKTDSEKNSSDMTVLGPVTHKLKFIPNEDTFK